MCRENEALRQTPVPSVAPRNKEVKYVAELAEDFDGSKDSFRKWEKQIRLLVVTYDLDDLSARMLVGLKLKGGAMAWYHSKPEYVTIDFERLLSQMKRIYDHRPRKLRLRKEFKQRRSHSNDTFTEYFHEKYWQIEFLWMKMS